MLGIASTGRPGSLARLRNCNMEKSYKEQSRKSRPGEFVDSGCHHQHQHGIHLMVVASQLHTRPSHVMAILLFRKS